MDRTSSRSWQAGLALLLLAAGGSYAPSASNGAEPAPSAPGEMSNEIRAALSLTVRGILVECVPEKIEKNDNWGDTRERFSQLKIKNDGLKLRFETNKKEVKHGLWKQVQVVPVDPQKNLKFEIAQARSTGRNAMTFQVVASSPLKLTARVERWRTGVKMLNFSTDADASIEMRVDGELTFEYVDIAGKSYLTFKPVIKTVDLKLVEFDIRRIGQADGPLVQEFGDMLSDPLADQLDKHEPKVAKKLNDTIVKRQDKLKIPMSLPFDFSDWSWSAITKSADPKPPAAAVPGGQ
ncbi:MAG: hypothetical protein K8U03_02880 [Planctomycetia bacterium]|nr:hypothetical protein [Planctomycetia bacterium]